MPQVSLVIPTLNSLRTIGECLEAINNQRVNKVDYEVIIADGGSTDGTREYCSTFFTEAGITYRIIDNPLITAEAGKAAGVRVAKYPIIGLIDSDNILPDEQWLKAMLEPFLDPRIIASEPISYTYRKKDNLINRYCALIGMNDPLCLFTGNYDRMCKVTGKWTQVPCEVTDRGGYLAIRFSSMIPTIGANGFFIRRQVLLDNLDGDYLFDIDIMWKVTREQPDVFFAKVKTGIIHMYCKNTLTFFCKQKRRISDFLYFSKGKGRVYPWKETRKSGILLFVLSCVSIVPLFVQATIGFVRKPSIAWLYHFPACWITLWVYGTQTILGRFRIQSTNRANWKQ